MTGTPDAARQRLIDRIIEHLDATPLPVRSGLTRESWPRAAHGEHTYDGWCAVCRASRHTDALRVLVAAVLVFAEADAHPERIAEAFRTPIELPAAFRLDATPLVYALEPEHGDPGTPQPAPDVVHAYQWFVDPRFDGLTVACQEPITAAGLTATADRDDVTCPACLARIKAGAPGE